MLYLITRSLGNRLRVQFRRLRKPQYLIGTVVGLAYFWFFFMRPGSPRGAGAPDGPAWGGAAP
ncbi:MAG: hypothetical protein KDM81_20525, partial [Verrucomicrobiae bacterium]|nr:hypothetical protein [Verrucomicrobiae bacterium]